MSLTYGFVKCTLASDPRLVPSRHKNETQYHLHISLNVDDGNGSIQKWDSAINVGTNDSDDLLQYKLIFDFGHSVFGALRNAPAGFSNLTGGTQLPALDFLRSDVLTGTGPWRTSDIMDGSTEVEPVKSLLRLLQKARSGNGTVYIFGRTYTDGSNGIHDIHMNQGSTGSFVNNGVDDHNDHNDVWQDGAVIVDLGEPQTSAYFTVFTKQTAPTDRLGNPTPDGHEIATADEGSLTGQ